MFISVRIVATYKHIPNNRSNINLYKCENYLSIMSAYATYRLFLTVFGKKTTKVCIYSLSIDTLNIYKCI